MDTPLAIIEAEEIERRAWRKLMSASYRLDSTYTQIGGGTVSREELAREIDEIARSLAGCFKRWNLACLEVQRLQAEARRKDTQKRAA